MKATVLTSIGIISLASLAFGDSQSELPLGASNCAIAQALKLSMPYECVNPPLGTARGIVLRLKPQADGTVSVNPTQDISVSAPAKKATTTISKIAKKETSNIDRAAAKSENGYFIHFAFNSFDLEPETKDHLGRLATVLGSGAMGSTCLRITGHTDDIGGADFNKELSQKRAIMVATYLSETGKLDPKRIQIFAAGEEKLLPDISASDPRNRRVEFSTKNTEGSCG